MNRDIYGENDQFRVPERILQVSEEEPVDATGFTATDSQGCFLCDKLRAGRSSRVLTSRATRPKSRQRQVDGSRGMPRVDKLSQRSRRRPASKAAGGNMAIQSNISVASCTKNVASFASNAARARRLHNMKIPRKY